MIPSATKWLRFCGGSRLSPERRYHMSYCPFFQTLHDETRPVGNLGRGTHYSVLRATATVWWPVPW